MNQDSNTQRRLELMRLIREEIIITSSVSAQGKKSFMEKAAVTAVRMNMATRSARQNIPVRKKEYICLPLPAACYCGPAVRYLFLLPGAGPQHRRHYGRSDRDSGKCAGRRQSLLIYQSVS